MLTAIASTAGDNCARNLFMTLPFVVGIGTSEDTPSRRRENT
jgi:hypothetical protein